MGYGIIAVDCKLEEEDEEDDEEVEEEIEDVEVEDIIAVDCKLEEEDEEDDGKVEDVEVEEEDEDDDDEDTGGGAFFFNLFASFSATESVALRLFRLFLGQSFEFALECVVLPHLQGLFDI